MLHRNAVVNQAAARTLDECRASLLVEDGHPFGVESDVHGLLDSGLEGGVSSSFHQSLAYLHVHDDGIAYGLSDIYPAMDPIWSRNVGNPHVLGSDSENPFRSGGVLLKEEQGLLR